jgi:hypothetical protein
VQRVSAAAATALLSDLIDQACNEAAVARVQVILKEPVRSSQQERGPACIDLVDAEEHELTE